MARIEKPNSQILHCSKAARGTPGTPAHHPERHHCRVAAGRGLQSVPQTEEPVFQKGISFRCPPPPIPLHSSLHGASCAFHVHAPFSPGTSRSPMPRHRPGPQPPGIGLQNRPRKTSEDQARGGSDVTRFSFGSLPPLGETPPIPGVGPPRRAHHR